MFKSIWDDIKREYRMGNMITKLMIANVAVYISFLMILIISRGLADGASKYEWFVHLFSVPGSFLMWLKQPWSLVTHMFLHEGFWHIFWNMLWLMWFGRIAGDLLGDRRILPLYLLSGFAGAVLYLIYCSALGLWPSYAMGASAAVSGIVLAAAATSPDYMIRLLLIGDVKIKYIAAFKILMDIVSISASQNVGGNIAHLGGALMGFLYVAQLRRGVDLGSGLQKGLKTIEGWFQSPKSQSSRTPKSTQTPMKVIHNDSQRTTKRMASQRKDSPDQQRMDAILEKIHQQGLNSLTQEEKDFLEDTRKRI